jgi:hypothetical protein
VGGAIPLLLQYAFMVWCSVKAQGTSVRETWWETVDWSPKEIRKLQVRIHPKVLKSPRLKVVKAPSMSPVCVGFVTWMIIVS